MNESKSLPFKLKRSELSLQALFTEPQFDLFANSPSLLRNLHSRLSKHGLRLPEMRIVGREGSIADDVIECNFFDFTTLLRIKIGGVELQNFDAIRVGREKLLSLAVDVSDAVGAFSPQASFGTLSFTVAFHGVLADSGPRSFLSRFTANAPDLGVALDSGVAFYYGPAAEQVSSFLGMEPSRLVEDGLFLRAQVLWDVSKLSSQAIPATAERYVQTVLSKVGLILIEG